jgi:hypothetical protein
MNKIYIFIIISFLLYNIIITTEIVEKDNTICYTCHYSCENGTYGLIEHHVYQYTDFNNNNNSWYDYIKCNSSEKCKLDSITSTSCSSTRRYIAEYTCPQGSGYKKYVTKNMTYPIAELTKNGYCNATLTLAQPPNDFCNYKIPKNKEPLCKCETNDIKINIKTNETLCNDLSLFVKQHSKEDVLQMINNEKYEYHIKPRINYYYF